jgi:pimeloyl-ACP methyl ester carboxylesterase
MPVMPIEDGEIYYEEFGSGFPVLCFSPGSLRSQISFWYSSPRDPKQTPGWMDPTTALAKDFRVIAMDQRNGGRSRGPVGPKDGWELYAGDQFALLDHLGIERCHVLGACIGVTFALKMCEMAPHRIASVGLMQPIGRVPENIGYTVKQVNENWIPALIKANSALNPKVMQDFGARLFGSEFVHSVSKEFVASCHIPMLIMPGHEVAHPAPVAEELLRLAPRGEYLKFWKGEGRDYSVLAIRDFFQRHSNA